MALGRVPLPPRIKIEVETVDPESTGLIAPHCQTWSDCGLPLPTIVCRRGPEWEGGKEDALPAVFLQRLDALGLEQARVLVVELSVRPARFVFSDSLFELSRTRLSYHTRRPHSGARVERSRDDLASIPAVSILQHHPRVVLPGCAVSKLSFCVPCAVWNQLS